jgi:deoxyribose-phosphate aldolase
MSDETDAEIARRALACLDLTELTDSCGEGDVERLVGRARTPFGDVAAVCVWPRFVSLARELIGADRIRIATVVNFPYGGENVRMAVEETKAAIADGADEIDVVLPYRAFAEGRADAAARMIDAVRNASGDALLKVILETGMLREPQLIRRAGDLAIGEGADFLKTSTGKVEVNATPDAAMAMLAAIRVSGRRVGLKPSGGIRTLADARTYVELADAAMGEGWAKPDTFRLGASSLLGALVEALGGGEQPPARGAY